MKVALIVPGFSATPDDPCIPVLGDVVRELSMHAEVHVFALRYPFERGRYRIGRAHVHALGGGDARGAQRVGLFARAARAVLREHMRERFNAVHGVWADEPGAIAACLGRVLRVPSVVSIMGGERVALPDIDYGSALSTLNRLLVAFSLRHSTYLTAGSSTGRAAIPRHVAHIPWGVDPSLFTPQGPVALLAGGFRVLHVGSLGAVKDHSSLLRALSLAVPRLPGLHLHIVGAGPLRSALAREAVDLGIEHHVTFHGHIARHHLAPYYRAAHVLAVTSRHEMQPVVALEAALCGCRVIGTPVGLIPDLVPHISTVVPQNDPQSFADALVTFAASSPSPVATLGPEYYASGTALSLMSLYRASAPRAAGHTPRAFHRPPEASTCNEKRMNR
jgi:glycosyltransferase involved in cell wall biosynthesis